MPVPSATRTRPLKIAIVAGSVASRLPTNRPLERRACLVDVADTELDRVGERQELGTSRYADIADVTRIDRGFEIDVQTIPSPLLTRSSVVCDVVQ